MYDAGLVGWSGAQRLDQCRSCLFPCFTGRSDSNDCRDRSHFFLSFPQAMGCICSLCSISLMTTLNSRTIGRAKRSSSIGGTFQLPVISASSRTFKEGTGNQAVVHVHTSTSTVTDALDDDRSSTGTDKHDPSLIELGQFRTKGSHEFES